MVMIPSTDNHIHVDPINGEGPLPVAQKFYRSGGTAMIIPNKPTWTVGEDCDFKRAMELVVGYVEEINRETEVQAFAVVGSHPAELSRLVREGTTLEEGEELMQGALETAQEMVLEGQAVAIGEVGRPHYEITPEEMEIHNRLLLYAMELAKEVIVQCSFTPKVRGPMSFGICTASRPGGFETGKSHQTLLRTPSVAGRKPWTNTVLDIQWRCDPGGT